MSKFQTIQAVYKQGGVVYVLRSILSYFNVDWLLLPVALVKIKGYKFQNIGSLVDFGFNVMGGLIRPLQIKKEIEQLLAVVKSHKVKVMLEIGTYNGGTLFLFSHVVNKDALIISVDFPDGLEGGGHGKWRDVLFKIFKLPAQHMFLVRGDSHKQDTLDKVNGILNGIEVDFIFIDGDHTYNGVKQDFQMYSPLLRKGGIIAFHDILERPKELHCEVDRFWKEVKGMLQYETLEVIDKNSDETLGIGIAIKRAE